MTAQTAPLDGETLGRAVLAHCVDGPDALMYATLKGAGDAMTLVDAIADVHAAKRDDVSDRGAGSRLDAMFMRGTARWGRRVDATGVKRFHQALERWASRLDTLPSLHVDDLRALFTGDGGMWIIAPHHPCWPHQLEDLSERADWAAPLCLWGRGSPQALAGCEGPVAVVGSRGVNDYGRTVAHGIGLNAALRGHLVVSGGAYGADAAAHWGAVAAAERHPERAGRTVAVFAGGLEHAGPQRNAELFARIVETGGALISEMSPQTVPEARRFLLRNRVIAALARTVVVAQARLRSGALNTANWGADLGREVYAAPGDVTRPDNAGCNMLIHENRAIILVDAEDVTEICHADHMPRRAEDLPGFEPPSPYEPAAPTLGTGVPPSSVHSDRPVRTPPDPDDDQRRVLRAIRRCRRRGETANEDALLADLRRADGADGGSDATGGATIGWLAQRLGAMELLGMVERTADGGFRPATGTA